jgi:hypothetical protein
MTNAVWLWWTFIVTLLLLAPIGYGLGPPHPTHFQRRRVRHASSRGSFNHQAWGWPGDLVWVVFLLAMVWLAVAFWWPYASR